MSIAREYLVNRVTNDVIVSNGVPSDAQMAQAVETTVADFNRRVRRIKITTLSVVNGTATYTLPVDFQVLVRMVRLWDETGIINTASGLIPVSSTFKERWTIAGNSITFYPTPTYTLTREITYGAKHVVDANGNYPDMTPEEAEIILLGARSEILGVQSAKAVASTRAYRMGDVAVDTTAVGDKITAQMSATRAAYDDAIASYIGTRTLSW